MLNATKLYRQASRLFDQSHKTLDDLKDDLGLRGPQRPVQNKKLAKKRLAMLKKQSDTMFKIYKALRSAWGKGRPNTKQSRALDKVRGWANELEDNYSIGLKRFSVRMRKSDTSNVRKRSKTFYVEYFVGGSMDQKVVKQMLHHAKIYAKYRNNIAGEKDFKTVFRSYNAMVKLSSSLARKAKRTDSHDYRVLAKRAREMSDAFKEQIEAARRAIRNNRKDSTDMQKRINSHYKKLSLMAQWLDTFQSKWRRAPSKNLYNQYHKRFKQLKGIVKITQQDMNYLKSEWQKGGANYKKVMRVHYQRARNVNEALKDLVKQYVYDQPPQNHPAI